MLPKAPTQVQTLLWLICIIYHMWSWIQLTVTVLVVVVLAPCSIQQQSRLIRMFLFDIIFPKEPRQVQTFLWLICIVKHLLAWMQTMVTLPLVAFWSLGSKTTIRNGKNDTLWCFTTQGAKARTDTSMAHKHCEGFVSINAVNCNIACSCHNSLGNTTTITRWS